MTEKVRYGLLSTAQIGLNAHYPASIESEISEIVSVSSRSVAKAEAAAKKHNIEPSNIETHFALLKRTAKSNKVEIFRVTSGKKKTENAINLFITSVFALQNHIQSYDFMTGSYGVGHEA